MKILIAPDSFKESLSSEKVAAAIATGWRDVFPDADLVLLPVADGGEGTTEALVAATGGQLFRETVTGPLGGAVVATWGMLGDGRTAVIETAAASGLDLVAMNERDPWRATSRGTGELILAALGKNPERIIVGLGGSATNDAGAGLLQALGARLLDNNDDELDPGGGSLANLATLDLAGLDSRLAQIRFDVACDVDNPLLGDQGASAVFGPQKGASPEMVARLDTNLGTFARVLHSATGKDVVSVPGAGAAGGLGAAFIGVFDAHLKSGIDIVLDAVAIDRHLAGADLVITGEGRIDGQTGRGKTPVGVSRRARRQNVPVIALGGSITDDAVGVHDQGIEALFSIVPGVVSLDQALSDTAANLIRVTRNIAAVWKLARRDPH